jgi:hypothetical protein
MSRKIILFFSDAMALSRRRMANRFAGHAGDEWIKWFSSFAHLVATIVGKSPEFRAGGPSRS